MLETKTPRTPVLKNENARKFIEKKKQVEMARANKRVERYRKMIQEKMAELEEENRDDKKTN